MRVKVDENVCAGTGACEQICPNVFKVVKGIATVQSDPVASADEEACREAVEACPTEAISIEE